MGEEQFAETAIKEARKKCVTLRRYSLGEIIAAVCQAMKVSSQDLATPLRQRKVKRARELLMYVARHYSRAALQEIADRLGVRDISTVSHGVSRVERQLRARGDLAEELETNLKRIHSLIQA